MNEQLRLPILAVAFAGLSAVAVVAYYAVAPQAMSAACRATAMPYARLELLFGLGRKDGTEIGEAEWRAFLDAEVTPALPRWAHGAQRLRPVAQQCRRHRQGEIA